MKAHIFVKILIYLKMNKIYVTIIALFAVSMAYSQKVDYSVVSVPEESGIDFLQITQSNDYLCMPLVKRNSNGVNWFTNHIIDVSPEGNDIAYLSMRNNCSNIFIKSLLKQGSSVQRTNRSNVTDFSYSPNGEHICFSEKRGKSYQIFQTSATKGYVCRQITTNNNDYSPIYTPDMSQIIFARQETNGVSIWGYNIKDNFVSSYMTGMNPCMLDNSTIICTRINNEGRGEIWKVDYETGIEECIISDIERSFTSPRVSPDGKWILFVGSSKITTDKFAYWNTDIYVAQTDGTNFTQITYHAADDLSPVWSKDGKYIYFVSQRGSREGAANIWRMTFTQISQ